MGKVIPVPISEELGGTIKLRSKLAIVKSYIENAFELVVHVGEQSVVEVKWVSLKLIMMCRKRVYS